MPQPPPVPTDPPPRWLVVVGSLLIAGHLAAVVVGVLAAASGPWPSFEGGAGMSTPPQFAYSANTNLAGPYLRLVKLTHTFHYDTDRPGSPGVYLEVRLKDEAGKEVATVKVPDDDANPWVRHRQALLAQHLGSDEPVIPPTTDLIAAPGQEVQKVRYWDMVEPGRLRMRTVGINQVPRDRPVMGPSEWSSLLARSYARYLCRAHGASKAEIIRHHQEAIPPAVLFQEQFPAGAFSEVLTEWGELPR